MVFKFRGFESPAFTQMPNAIVDELLPELNEGELKVLLYIVRRLMRHVKIEQTLTYEHMTSKHLQNTVVKYDPLVRKYATPLEVLESFKENIEAFGIHQDTRFSEEFRKGLLDLIFKEGERLRNAQ